MSLIGAMYKTGPFVFGTYHSVEYTDNSIDI